MNFSLYFHMIHNSRLDPLTPQDLTPLLLNDVKHANVHRHENDQKKAMFRVVIPPNDTTSYKEGHQGQRNGEPYKLVQGVRVGDYVFEESTGFEYVLARPDAGLSFSTAFSHLKSTRKMLSKHAKGYENPGPANVAWWILESKDIPKEMAFVQDPKNKKHYFLTVTDRMHIDTLVKNLKTVANNMSAIKDLTFEV